MTADHDGPVTVHTGRPALDPADLRATIAEVQYLYAGNGVDPTDPLWSGVNWDELTEAERDPWLRDADAIIAALTAAGWPTTAAAEVDRLRARPDDDGPDESLAMAVADVDQLTAQVDRLTAQLAQVTRERDDRSRVLQAVIKQRDTAYRARDEAQAEVERLRGMLRVAQRDAAQHKAAAARLADEMRRAVRNTSLTMGEALALDANDRLRAGIQALIDRKRLCGADDLRALLDGTTPAPNTTQPLYCAECGTALDINDRIAICPDCPRLFCGIGCQRTHRKLGTCPDHADGVLAGPASSPTADQPAPGEGQDTTETQEAAQADATETQEADRG